MAVKDSGKKTHTTVVAGEWRVGGTCAPMLAIETVKSIHGYLSNGLRLSGFLSPIAAPSRWRSSAVSVGDWAAVLCNGLAAPQRALGEIAV